MDPFEYYTFKEAIDNENGFTRSHTQVYTKLPDNIQGKDNMISNANNYQRGAQGRPLKYLRLLTDVKLH